VLDLAVNIPFWYRLYSSHWDDWLVPNGCSGNQVIADPVGWHELNHFLQPYHLQSALTDTHFSLCGNALPSSVRCCLRHSLFF